MGGHDDKTRPCSVCRGKGAVNVLHMQKECLNCHNKYHAVRLDNQIVRYSHSIQKCYFCTSVCVVESMVSVIIDCPLCLGTGTRTWIDKIVRPYKNKNFERRLLEVVTQP